MFAFSFAASSLYLPCQMSYEPPSLLLMESELDSDPVSLLESSLGRTKSSIWDSFKDLTCTFWLAVEVTLLFLFLQFKLSWSWCPCECFCANFPEPFLCCLYVEYDPDFSSLELGLEWFDSILSYGYLCSLKVCKYCRASPVIYTCLRLLKFLELTSAA